jgi:DNA-binding XRE family transcriptional regulator
LPICNIQLKAQKPNRKPYPKEFNTYGDHIRKKRLDLNLSQTQVAKIINVTTDTITNWELNRSEPSLNQIPKIISFLGYSPDINENPIKKYRTKKGISQKKLARILEIDPTTLSRIEGEKGGKVNNRIKVKLNELLKDTHSSIFIF